ncbi:MAG: type I glyceraldehyde-3-phosphate dehydrogenase [bacterium]|nr:type I glyceraldehyde-3-phosphate dehydrogenase [bacterium]MBU1918734.1 type I glyceraldehyde-3-phosphate dehydrogenase [bacterium]
MTVNIGINGFGRIGRGVLRAAEKLGGYNIIAINDLLPASQHAHLLKYDSVHGIFDGKVSHTENALTVNGKEIKITAEKDPSNIPWGKLGVDIVFECTGFFRSREQVSLHLQAGAKKVIISAPAKDEDITVVMGVNHENYKPDEHHILSNASCTTNCLAPVVKVLHDMFTVKHGLMTTIHSYTNDQRILDVGHSDLRRARAGAMSMIPTSTGAAKAIGLVMPELKGKLDGFAVRVPTPNVSCVDFVCEIEKSATKEEINAALKEASEGSLKGILGYTELPLVSIDYNGNTLSSSVDGLCTTVMNGNMVKILTWYDNETGFSYRMLDLAKYIADRL